MCINTSTDQLCNACKTNIMAQSAQRHLNGSEESGATASPHTVTHLNDETFNAGKAQLAHDQHTPT